MDRKIETKFWNKKRISRWGALSALLFLVSFFGFKALNFTHKVERSRLQMATVQFTDFNESIPVSGSAEPIKTVMINALEGGRVEEVYLDEGTMVKAGDKLLKLSNTALSLDFMNRETQIIEQINNLRNTRIALQQNQRQNEDQLITFENQLKLIERQFLADTLLARKNAISDIEYFNSVQRYDLAKKQFVLAKQRVGEDELYRKTQIARIDASIHLMERNLDAIRKHLESLTVKAPIEGQLNSFDHEIGANLQRGQTIGRVDNLSGYKISAQVDQYYLNRIKTGIEAEFDYSGKKFWLIISKVSPTIMSGQFEVEFEFKDEVPSNLRRGQLFQIRILLSATAKALIITKGAFFQSSGGKWVFVTNKNGEAYKKPITTGRQNSRYIEITSGLVEGEEIIISSYEAFKEYDQINIIE
ncbi:MAG: efflux RND transporter periplasmic adaptor subunit [Bacteroidia bacterium]